MQKSHGPGIPPATTRTPAQLSRKWWRRYNRDEWFVVSAVNVVRAGRDVSEREQVRVARIMAAAVGLLSIILASGTGATTNAAALVAGLAFVIASAANLPAILFTLFWKRFNTYGAVAALLGGTIMTIWLYAIGPGFSRAPNAPAALTPKLFSSALASGKATAAMIAVAAVGAVFLRSLRSFSSSSSGSFWSASSTSASSTRRSAATPFCSSTCSGSIRIRPCIS